MGLDPNIQFGYISKMVNCLRELRTARHLSQQALADRVGTTKTQISKLETAQRQLTQTWMERLATALDCHPADLISAIAPGAESHSATRLRRLRLRTGLSVGDVAHAIGRSAYGYYETVYNKKYIPHELAEKLVPLFEQHGVSESEVLALAGYRVQETDENGCHTYSEEPDINYDDSTAAALWSIPDHLALLHADDIDEGTLYRVAANHSDYDRYDAIKDVLYHGEHPYARLWILTRSALDMAGYLPGDILAVDLHVSPQPGDIVCATFPDIGHQVTGFRIFSPPFLLTASSLPRFRSPLLIDNSSVVVHGVVTGSLRRRMADSSKK